MLVPSRDLWQDISARIDAPVIPLHAGHRVGSRLGTGWSRWASMAAAAVLLIALTSTATYFATIRHGSTDSSTVVAKESSSGLASARPSTEAPDGRTVAVATTPDSGRTARPAGGTTARGETPVVAVRNKKLSAEQVYASEIAHLHIIVEQRRSQLDPVTISVIERNLKVIDDAIAQCRMALAKDPASRFLMESLNSALETKVELLRTASMLPARS